MLTSLRNREAAMPFIMLTALIDMLAIGLISPVLPALVGELSGSPADQVFWYGMAAIGFGLANFLSSPILGALSDRYGRRPVLMLGFFGLGVSFFGTALTPTLWGLIVARTMGGAMQSNLAIANAYVADITPPEDRAKRFGLLGSMMGVGFIIGPVMGGLLGASNLKLPFWIAGGLVMLNVLYGYFVLPESLPPSQRKAMNWRAANPLRVFKNLAELKGVGPLVGVVVCNGLAQFILYTSWLLYNTFKFGWGPFENGLSLAVVGVVSVLVQGVLMGRLIKRFGVQRLMIMGLLSSITAYLLWGAASEGWMMFAVVAFNLLGGTVAASVQALISASADKQSQGQILGAVSALSSLTAVVAPILATPLLAAVSHLPKGDWRIGAPFYFCALIQLVSLALAVKHLRKSTAAHSSVASS